MLRQHPVVYASTLSNLMSTYLILCPRTMYMSHKLYVYAPQTIRIHSIESYVHELCIWVTNYMCTRHKLYVSTLSNLMSTNYVHESQTIRVRATNYTYPPYRILFLSPCLENWFSLVYTSVFRCVHELCIWVTNYVCMRHKLHVCGGCLEEYRERWGAGVETPKNVRGEIEGWGRVPFNEPYAPSLSTIYDGA